jgi:mycothiol system anti-sigma-R factor
MTCEEAQEYITALVDKELSGLEQSSIEGHLQECSGCRRLYETEMTVKQAVSTAGAELGAPAELRHRILSDRRIFASEGRPARKWTERIRPAWLGAPALRPALALALFAVLIVALLYLVRPSAEPIALAALQVQKKIIAGDIALHKTGDPNELSDWLRRSVAGRFAPMQYDLSALRLQPVGGTVENINGRKVLVTVYAGSGMSVTCFTFIGTEGDAPENATVIADPGMPTRFYLFSEGALHAVLHVEKNMICILVSELPANELVAMIRAQAAG